jgi:acetyl esterase
VIDEQYRVGAVPRDILSPVEARTAWQRLPVGVGPDVGGVEDVQIDGATWRARVYRPIERPIGTLLYMHGGGWVTGTIDGSDAVCRRLALLDSCNVVSLDYRLAPEFPFPAALEDEWD